MNTIWTILVLTPMLVLQNGVEDATFRLLEASCNYFGEGGYQPPSSMPWIQPPELTLYRDGTVVFERDGRFYEGEVKAEALKRIKKRLGDSTLLQKTSVKRSIPGKELLMHGGVCHLAYKDREARVIIAATVSPTKGAWTRLIRMIRRDLPLEFRLYIPSTIRLSIAPTKTDDWPPWEQEASLDLGEASLVSSVEVTDRSLVKFLFTRRPVSPVWHFSQGDVGYRIALLEVPGWYEPLELEEVIWELAEQLALPLFPVL